MRVAIEQRTTSKALRLGSRLRGQVNELLDVVDRLDERLVAHLEETPGEPDYWSDRSTMTTPDAAIAIQSPAAGEAMSTPVRWISSHEVVLSGRSSVACGSSYAKGGRARAPSSYARGDVPDILRLTFADGTTEQIEVERGRADQEFEDLRNRDGRYEGGWIVGESESERWKWLNLSMVVSVEIHRESDDDSQPA